MTVYADNDAIARHLLDSHSLQARHNKASAGSDVEPSRTILDVRVFNANDDARDHHAGGVDSIRGEIVDVAVLDVQRDQIGAISRDVDAVYSCALTDSAARTRAVDHETSQDHPPLRVVSVPGGAEVDVYAIDAAGENRGLVVAAVDRDRLGNRHGAEAAVVEGVNFAADKSFGNSTCKSLTGG